MKKYNLISWNVNGIRAIFKKVILDDLNFVDWIKNEAPTVLCFQETKASVEQLPKKLTNIPDYRSFWASAERKGYSGVATYTRQEPLSVDFSLGIRKFDKEGRVLETEFPEFVLYNVYFPNGKRSQERLDYKMDFYEHFLEYINEKREQGKSIVFCGDVNTAHKPIDLARPEANENISGFLPIERKWIDKVIENGYVDTFRAFHDEQEQYTWWSYRTRARNRNVGWRLDYFFVSEDIIDNVKDSTIMSNVYGSDHCPINLTLEF